MQPTRIGPGAPSLALLSPRRPTGRPSGPHSPRRPRTLAPSHCAPTLLTQVGPCSRYARFRQSFSSSHTLSHIHTHSLSLPLCLAASLPRPLFLSSPLLPSHSVPVPRPHTRSGRPGAGTTALETPSRRSAALSPTRPISNSSPSTAQRPSPTDVTDLPAAACRVLLPLSRHAQTRPSPRSCLQPACIASPPPRPVPPSSSPPLKGRGQDVACPTPEAVHEHSLPCLGQRCDHYACRQPLPKVVDADAPQSRTRYTQPPPHPYRPS